MSGLSTDEGEAGSDRTVRVTGDEPTVSKRSARSRTPPIPVWKANSASSHSERHVGSLGTTHAAAIRGCLRLDTWGVYVDCGRTVGDSLVERMLGPTV